MKKVTHYSRNPTFLPPPCGRKVDPSDCTNDGNIVDCGLCRSTKTFRADYPELAIESKSSGRPPASGVRAVARLNLPPYVYEWWDSQPNKTAALSDVLIGHVDALIKSKNEETHEVT